MVDGPQAGAARADAAPPRAPDNQGELRSEVEEFLRRLGQGDEPQAEPARQAHEPPPARRGVVDPFEDPPPRRRRPAPAETRAEQPVELLIAEESSQEQRPAPRREKELRHLPESQLAEEAAHLGERIAQADDRLESRLHKKFDHRLGKLESGRDERTAAAAAAAAAEQAESAQASAAKLRGLLARPGGVREAVVLSEIFRRPGERDL